MKHNIAKSLEDWFAVVKRPMPWRKKPTPYCCWLSEIMMQLTTATRKALAAALISV